MSTLPYKRFVSSLKKSKNKIFLFNGSENFLKEEGTTLLLEKYNGQYDKDFDLVELSGKEISTDQIYGELGSMPLMNEYRVIIVKNVNKCTIKIKNIIKKWLDNPGEHIIGIFSTSERVNPKKVKFIEKFVNCATVVNCYEIQYGDMVQRITDSFKEYNKKIDKHIIDHMIDMIGLDLFKMKNEIKKVLIYINDKDSVTLNDINAVVSNIRSDSIFTLVDTIFSNDITKSLKITSNVIRDRSDQGILLVSLLSRQLKNVIMYRELANSGLRDNVIAQKIGINQYFLKDIANHAIKTRAVNVVEAFKKLLSVDVKLKSSPLSCNAIIEGFVLEFCNR